MDRPDAVGHFRGRCGLSSSAQGRHAGAPGRRAPRPGAGRAAGRSIRGHRAGDFVGGASEAAHLGRQCAVRAMAVCDRPQQADRFAAPPRPAGFRQHRRFRRDDPERASRGDGSCERGRGPVAVAAGAAARRTAIDRGRQRVDQGYGCEIRDERGRGARGAAPRACQPQRQTAGAMRMETDQLIRTLAADNAHRARPVGFVLALALLAAAPVSVAIFVAGLGFRPDVMTAMHNPFFDLKFAVTLALAIPAIAISLHLSRPEASLHGWAWLLLIPAGLLVAGISGEMMLPQRLPMMTRLVGSNSRTCLTAIPLMSLPLLAAALIGLRHGAPTRPVVTGAIAGLLSAGLAATRYASHCPDDSPLFVATWYTLATALVTAIGALAGSGGLRFLRPVTV